MKSRAPINPHEATFNHQRTERLFVNSLAVLLLQNSPVPRLWGFVGVVLFTAKGSYGSWTSPSGMDHPRAQDWKISCESHHPGNVRFNVSIGGR